MDPIDGPTQLATESDRVGPPSSPPQHSAADLSNLSACPHSATKLCESTVIASVLVLGVINVVVIAGNILVVVAVFVSPKLRTVTNFFIVSLAIADLLVGIVVLPYSISHEALDVWIFGELWCQVWLAVDVWMCTSSILNLCAISVDRYLAVTRPFKYRSIMSSRRAKLLIAAVWVLSFIICFPPLVGWNDKSTAQIATFKPPPSSYFSPPPPVGGGSSVNNRSTQNVNHRTSGASSSAKSQRGRYHGVNSIDSASDHSTPVSLNPDEMYANFGNPNSEVRVGRHLQHDLRDNATFVGDSNDDFAPSSIGDDTSHRSSSSSVSSNSSMAGDGLGVVRPSASTTDLCIVTKCALINNKGYVIYSALGSFYIPMFVMLFFYWRIYLVASGTTRALKRGYRTTKSQRSKSGGVAHGGAGVDNGGVDTGGTSVPEERLTLRIHRGYPASDFGGSASPGSGNGHGHHHHHQHHLRRAASQKARNPPPLSPSHSGVGGSARSSHESDSLCSRGGFDGSGTGSGISVSSSSTIKTPSRSRSVNYKKSYSSSMQLMTLAAQASNVVDSRYDVADVTTTASSSSSSFRVGKGNSSNGNRTCGHKLQRPPPSSSSSGGGGTPLLVTRVSKRTTKWQAKRFHAETKAAKTVGIIVGGFVCCWLPFFTVYLTRAFCESCIPDLLFSIFFWLGYCNSAINPFIYALFSRDFRNAFRNIVCRCKFREDGAGTGVSSLIRQIHLPTFFEEVPPKQQTQTEMELETDDKGEYSSSQQD